MAATITWSGTATALSSIAHGGDTRGTITLLRRELVRQPDGRLVHVPIISGNAFRGRLRRIGEELLRDTLRYDNEIPLAAAHALRGGGALAKVSAAPLSGRRLQQLRELVPHIGVFGCAGGGRIIDGCLQVGKLVPHVRETVHITGRDSVDVAAFDATQLETYVRHDDTDAHDFTDAIAVHRMPVDSSGEPMLEELPTADSRHIVFRVETFPSGTTLSTWLRLERATDLEASFFTDVLAAFTAGGRIGGRGGTGHGQLQLTLTATATSVATGVDWRAHLVGNRDATIAALHALT